MKTLLDELEKENKILEDIKFAKREHTLISKEKRIILDEYKYNLANFWSSKKTLTNCRAISIHLKKS